jgi:hypothetical protein
MDGRMDGLGQLMDKWMVRLGNVVWLVGRAVIEAFLEHGM